MKKFIAWMTALCLLLGCCAGALAQEMSAEQLQARYDEEMHLARYIVNRGAAYEYDSFLAYVHYWFQKAYSVVDSKKLSITEVENGQEIVETLTQLREGLTQIVEDPEQVCWYIWGEDMPEAEDAASYDYTQTYDEAGFKPFLVPYLLEDQAAVKGNAIIIAGGGFNQRCNDGEGYPSAVIMNQMGYNAYILQRRVAPSAAIDSSLDLQRAIRYLYYNAGALGIGKIENMVTIGFSGGGGTILNQLNTCYGDITPDAVYSTYACDQIDRVNSDYPVAAVYYGVLGEYETANENMPALFLSAGGDDYKVPFANTVNFYLMAREKEWTAELYIPSGAPHGYAMTGIRAFNDVGSTAAAQTPALLETFLNVQFGYLPAQF